MRFSLVFTGALSLFLSLNSFARNPVGEIAKYKLDRNRTRTSTMLTKGLLDFKGGPFKPKEGTKGSYDSQFTYDVNIIMAGHKKGSKHVDIPAEFFSTEYQERLRKEGQIDEEKFKLKYLGVEDVETMDGLKYPKCDKILVYDIKAKDAQDFTSFINDLFGSMYVAEHEESEALVAKIENIQVVIAITDTVPFLGAVKIDASGRVKGFEFKAGFDYTPPAKKSSQGPALGRAEP